jgi:hypothetical protein
MATKIKAKARRVKTAVDQVKEGRLQEAQEAVEAHLGAARGLREMAKRLEGEAVLLGAAATAWEKRAGVLSQLTDELNAARSAAQQP